MKQTQNNHVINSLFPTPVYMAKRDSDLDSTEEKEIEDVIEEGMRVQLSRNHVSKNSYIFNSKLKKIKQFCEQHIKIYVKEIITHAELDIYITQSWLNITRPGEYHHSHHHPNSIISGVFYIATVEEDNILFSDPNNKLKNLIIGSATEVWNIWNSPLWFFHVNNNELFLFPSWLEHEVKVNEKATTDRISLAFNTFVRGTLGERKGLTELIL